MDAHGTFCWNELLTHEVERAKAFYADTIGWTFDAAPTPHGGTYWIASLGDRQVAGLFDLTELPGAETMIEAWMPYLAVDDVDFRSAAAIAAGAKLQRPVFDIPAVGRVALLSQPGGAGLAWMTPVASTEKGMRHGT